MNVIRENQRGKVDMGWLKSAHSFSFGQYYNPETIHFGALRVLNDDYIKGGNGFPMHPHDNMEIITIVLNGTLEHKDTMGNKGKLLSGDVQLMGAGTGIFHSESNPDPLNPLELLQIWVFPGENGMNPTYQQKNFSHELTSGNPIVLLGPDESYPLKIRQKAWFTRWKTESAKEINYTINEPSSGLYVFVIEGDINVNNVSLSKRDAITIENLSNLQINVKSDKKSDVLLMEVPMQW
jgi:quercetin 2,3-dioxygenase